jgi:hypothetical protein
VASERWDVGPARQSGGTCNVRRSDTCAHEFADFTAAPIDRQGDVWLINEFYFRKIKLLLALVSNSVIESAIGVSRYTGRIR